MLLTNEKISFGSQNGKKTPPDEIQQLHINMFRPDRKSGSHMCGI
jgi:hypothetical protein